MNTDLHYLECIQGPYLAEDAREVAEDLHYLECIQGPYVFYMYSK